MQEEKKSPAKNIGRVLVVIVLAAAMIIGPIVSAKTQVQFSAQNYIQSSEESAAYAAQVTENETAYLSDDHMSRNWKYLQTVGHLPKTYDDFVLYAEIAVANEDFTSAANYLDGAVKAAVGNEPELGELYMRLGSIYILQDKTAEAVKMLDEALKRDESLSSAWFLKAQLAVEAGKTEEAAEAFARYIRLPDSDPAETAGLAELFEALEDYDSAVICYTAGIEDESLTSPKLYADRARCEILQEDMAAAGEDLKTYFTLTDEDPEGRPAAMMAMCLMEKGSYEEAAEYFHKAIEDGYENPAILYSQSAKSAFAAGDYEMAVEDGLKALESAQESGSDSAEAAAEADDAAPEDDAVAAGADAAAAGTGNDAAEAYIDAAGADSEPVETEENALAPETAVNIAETEFWVALAYMAQEEYEEAAAHLAETKAQNADYPDIDYYLGVCALAQEDYDTAEEQFTASIEKEEDMAASYYNRAVCYVNDTAYKKAKADLQEVISRNEEEELTAQAEELLNALEEAGA